MTSMNCDVNNVVIDLTGASVDSSSVAFGWYDPDKHRAVSVLSGDGQDVRTARSARMPRHWSCVILWETRIFTLSIAFTGST
mmetsp:Transcript_24180/g.56398  ORF Transcript_24180/g.56398 Transcript_24180/m.56398 type:complete len:82 (-) Transcript_24180:35-280(-)